MLAEPVFFLCGSDVFFLAGYLDISEDSETGTLLQQGLEAKSEVERKYH